MSAYFFNRRLFFRRTINEPAWIERASNSILERCTLVNVCEIGARLMIGDVYDLPESFVLHLTRGSETGRQCWVIWQRNHEVGVEFCATGNSANKRAAIRLQDPRSSAHSIPKKLLKPLRRQGGIAGRILNVAMPQVRLHRTRAVPSSASL